MANLFSKLKEIKDLRQQAKTLQGALAGETFTAESSGVSVTVNGSFELTEVRVTEELSREQVAGAFRRATNEAIKKMQKTVAQKVQAMGGLSKFGGK